MTTPPQGQNPYGQGVQPQHPGQPAQPGQPGVPPQQPYPPYNQGAPVPPPAAPSGGGRAKKLALRIGSVIVIGIIIAVGKWYLGKSDAESTAVGDCLHNKGTQSQPDLKNTDCSSSDAQFEVIEKFDDTSSVTKCNAVKGTEVSYYQTGGGHDVVLCLKNK
ncbi:MULTISPECIES: LppU/SCO3897 family protein [Streptomyces]|uniref:LppU/SCO3897 family protein n=1 Tax=Streptomyces sp. SYP-A7185 TaxID=3040076 RepID=UPI0038F5EE18